MEYIVIAGCIAGGWSLLLILSGERFNRLGALVQDAAKEAVEADKAHQNTTL